MELTQPPSLRDFPTMNEVLKRKKTLIFPLKSKIGDRIVIIRGVFLEYFFGLIKYLKVKRTLVNQV